MKTRHHRLPVLPVLAFILLFPALLALGFWQIDRAYQKQTAYEAFLARRAMPAVDLSGFASRREEPESLLWRKARASGRLRPPVMILLDNQVVNGSVGYMVFAPLEIIGTDDVLLVNRGWVPAGESRQIMPSLDTPAEALELTGEIYNQPTPVMLGQDNMERFEDGVYRVQRIDPVEIGETLNLRLLPYMLRLDSSSPAGFARSWAEPGSGKEKHLGYAFQWFALAATLFIIAIIQIRRRFRDAHNE